MNQPLSQKGSRLLVRKNEKILKHNYLPSNLFLLFFMISLLGASCSEELPVRINGKVTHAITGEGISDIEVNVENITCNGFAPVICDHKRLMEQSNSTGEFSFSYFQDCESEIYAELPREYETNNHRKFIYKEIAGRDDDRTCNDRPRIVGDDGYYFEIVLQPQMYVDIYAVDDPSQELTSFSFNGEPLEIIESSHFQKRFKIDINAFNGEFIFTTNYRNPTETKEYIPYNYMENDEMVYEVRY